MPDELPFRPERLVLTSAVADDLVATGRVVVGVEHFADGITEIIIRPVEQPLYSLDDADHDDLCACLDCQREQAHWHAWARHDGDETECADCAGALELLHQRARLIARLKGRILQSQPRLEDPLHPRGRCTCGGEGHCAWCELTCNDCGCPIHYGECPDGLARKPTDA